MSLMGKQKEQLKLANGLLSWAWWIFCRIYCEILPTVSVDWTGRYLVEIIQSEKRVGQTANQPWDQVAVVKNACKHYVRKENETSRDRLRHDTYVTSNIL